VRLSSFLSFISIPEPVKPLPLLLPGDLAVSHGGGDALMAQVLLEHPDAVAGIIQLYSVYREGVPQPVRAYAVHLTRLGIFQPREPGLFGTSPHYLPGPVPVDAKKKKPASFGARTLTVDVFP
jgi:hypothetical protein